MDTKLLMMMMMMMMMIQPVVIKCHTQITYMWRQNYYLLNTIQNSSPNNTGYPASNHTIRVITSPPSLPQLET